MCFGGDGGAGKIAAQQRADEAARQARIQSGMARINDIFGGFGDDYYAARAKAYTDYATPQLDRAYKSAKDNMIYALDRSGILNSSAAINKNASLSDDFDQSRLDIANKAQDTANQARQNVENIRSNIVTQLNATGDDSAAADAAVRQATALNQPAGAYSPLAGLFSNFTDSLAAIGSNARNNYGGFFGGGAPVYSTSGKSSSSRVVR